MMRFVVLSCCAAIALAGCGVDEDDILFDGQYFKTRLKSERGDRPNFTVTARPVSASLLGAREAARYEATVYCVNNYGRSDIAWDVGPDSPDDALTIDSDTLVFAGRCPE